MKQSDSYKVLKAVVGTIMVAVVATALYPVPRVPGSVNHLQHSVWHCGNGSLDLVFDSGLALKGVTQLESAWLVFVCGMPCQPSWMTIMC